LLFRVSDNTLRKEPSVLGSCKKAREEEWKVQSQNESWLQERLQKFGKQAGRLYGSIDGVMAPCRGEWREMKNIAWYQVEQVRSYEQRRHHASSVANKMIYKPETSPIMRYPAIRSIWQSILGNGLPAELPICLRNWFLCAIAWTSLS